jgi:hypothetical protein
MHSFHIFRFLTNNFDLKEHFGYMNANQNHQYFKILTNDFVLKEYFGYMNANQNR